MSSIGTFFWKIIFPARVRLENRRKRITFWLSGASIMAMIPTFALLVLESNKTEAGSVEDDCFWSQLQASIAQMAALIIAGMSISGDLFSMVPTVLASISAMLAIPLYLVAPTAWSSFFAMFATALQTLVTMQLALT